MNVDELVSKYYDRLNVSDRHIWQYIYHHKRACSEMYIEELAQRCNVSRSTVMRFAQKLELKGFSDLKTLLRWEINRVVPETENIVDIICDTNIKTIDRFRHLDCNPISKKLYEANRIFVYGTGSVQKAVAMEFKRILLSLGILVEVIAGEGELSKTIRMVHKDDVVFFISKSGSSATVLNNLDELKIKNACVLSLTFSGNNQLANRSDYALFLESEQVSFRNELVIESVTLLFPVVEILAAKFMNYIQLIEKE